MVRWPGHIKPGQVSNEIFSGLDWFPTLVAAAGDPDITDKLKNGYKAEGKTFKNHLDGYNQLAYLTGQEKKSARNMIWYFSDELDLLAVRYNNWKLHFTIMEGAINEAYRKTPSWPLIRGSSRCSAPATLGRETPDTRTCACTNWSMYAEGFQFVWRNTERRSGASFPRSVRFDWEV